MTVAGCRLPVNSQTCLMANYSDSRKSFLESQGQAYLISEAQEVRLFQKTQKHAFRYQIRKLFAEPLTDCVLQLERF
jgi:hypothetical protein